MLRLLIAHAAAALRRCVRRRVRRWAAGPPPSGLMTRCRRCRRGWRARPRARQPGGGDARGAGAAASTFVPRAELPARRAGLQAKFVAAGAVPLVLLVLADVTLPAPLFEHALHFALAALSRPGAAARAQILAALSGERRAAILGGIRHRLRSFGAALGLAVDDSGGVEAEGLSEYEQALRGALLLLRLIQELCAGPDEDIQLALCGGGEHDCIEVAALLLLAWEGRLDADLLPLARHAALAVAALCEGPCDANQRALLASPAPASAARLLAKPFPYDVYPATHVRSLRAALAALLRCALEGSARSPRAAALWPLLRPRLLHERLVDVHTEWQRLDAARTAAADAGKEELPQPQAEARAAEQLGAVEASEDDDDEPPTRPASAASAWGGSVSAASAASAAAADEEEAAAGDEWLAAAELAAVDAPRQRWAQLGVPAWESSLLAEGYELFALMSTLASQLPELRAPLQRASPLDTSPADAADGDAAAVSAAAVGAALSFFDERLGCVQLQWRNKLRRVFFPLPPLCLGLPVALRAKAALPQRTFSSLTAEAKLRDFCRRCRATLKQLEYQRSLSHFGVLSTLTSRLAPLMWAQLALVALANLLLLAAALPSANDDGADAAAATAYSQANASAPWPPAPPPAFPPPSPPPPASPPAGGGEPPSAFLASSARARLPPPRPLCPPLRPHPHLSAGDRRRRATRRGGGAAPAAPRPSAASDAAAGAALAPLPPRRPRGPTAVARARSRRPRDRTRRAATRRAPAPPAGTSALRCALRTRPPR